MKKEYYNNGPVVKDPWTDCLFEIAKKAKENGEKVINFSDVDKLFESKYKLDGEINES